MQEEDRRASTSSGDPNDDAIRDLDVIEREPRRQRGVSDPAHHFHHGVSPRPDSSTATRATESVQAWRHREASLILGQTIGLLR